MKEIQYFHDNSRVQKISCSCRRESLKNKPTLNKGNKE